jgi:hypothetical protein
MKMEKVSKKHSFQSSRILRTKQPCQLKGQVC